MPLKRRSVPRKEGPALFTAWAALSTGHCVGLAVGWGQMGQSTGSHWPQSLGTHQAPVSMPGKAAGLFSPVNQNGNQGPGSIDEPRD